MHAGDWATEQAYVPHLETAYTEAVAQTQMTHTRVHPNARCAEGPTRLLTEPTEADFVFLVFSDKEGA